MTECKFEPSQQLTFETVQNNRLRFIKLMRNQADLSGIRVNLAGVTRCDSTGLALLIETKRYCIENQISFAMDNVPESILALATFCEVNEVLHDKQ